MLELWCGEPYLWSRKWSWYKQCNVAWGNQCSIKHAERLRRVFLMLEQCESCDVHVCLCYWNTVCLCKTIIQEPQHGWQAAKRQMLSWMYPHSKARLITMIRMKTSGSFGVATLDPSKLQSSGETSPLPLWFYDALICHGKHRSIAEPGSQLSRMK